MTVREHLKRLHGHLADHHLQMSKLHKAMLADCVEDTPEHTFHKSAMESHLAMAEENVQLADECAKATASVDLNKSDMGGDELEPTQVSTVYPDGHRLVRRAGDSGNGDGQAPRVELQFQKLVSVEEES